MTAQKSADGRLHLHHVHVHGHHHAAWGVGSGGKPEALDLRRLKKLEPHKSKAGIELQAGDRNPESQTP